MGVGWVSDKKIAKCLDTIGIITLYSLGDG